MAAPSTLRRSPRLQAGLQHRCITDLPCDLLRCIAQRLPSGQDVARFRLTGRPWRDAVPLGGFAPLLMLPESRDGSATFHRRSDGKILEANLPGLQGKVVCGSSRGWLALVDEAASVTLLNPFTGATVVLPPADNKLGAACFRKLSMDVDGRWVVLSSQPESGDRGITLSEMRELLFRNIVLSSHPDSADCVAMAQLASPYSVAFCRVGVVRAWTVLHADLTCRIRSVLHCHGSTFLAIGEVVGISIFDLAGATPSVRALWRCLSPPERVYPRSYLQVDGKLHLVGTVLENSTRHTRVYMCDVFAGKRMWSGVTDIGNQTLFVSNMFMSGHGGASIAGLMMNSVYFSEHLDGHQEDPDHKLEIFNIGNGKPELLSYTKKVQGLSKALCWIQPRPNLWKQETKDDFLSKQGMGMWKNQFAPTDNTGQAIQDMSSTPSSKIGEPAPHALAVSTSTTHAQGKRKDKAPLVETEAAAKECTEEMLQQNKRKKEAKQSAKGPAKKNHIFKH